MARDMRNWMWAEALALLDQAERVHRGTFRPGAGQAHRLLGTAGRRARDRGRAVDPGGPAGRYARAAPGRHRGPALLVTGERTLPVPRGAGVIRRLEMPYGTFERRIDLPAGRYELVRRELTRGCLTLTLRKLV